MPWEESQEMARTMKNRMIRVGLILAISILAALVGGFKVASAILVLLVLMEVIASACEDS